MASDTGTSRHRVLLALDEQTGTGEANRTEMARLFRAARSIAQAQKSDGLLVLGLVHVPEGQSLSGGATSAQQQRALLDEIVGQTENPEGNPEGTRLDVKTVVRVCQQSELAQELNDVILENQVDLLLLGSGWFDAYSEAGTERSPLETIFRRPLCDLAIIGPGVDIDISKRILLPARGGPFAELALRLASGVAEHNNGHLTLLHVVREDVEEDEFEDAAFSELARSAGGQSRVSRRQVVAANVQEGIVQEAQNQDLVFMGATANIAPARAEALFQNPFGPVARAVLATTEYKRVPVAGLKPVPEISRNGPGVIIVRAGAPKDFYFARLQRRKQQSQARMMSDDYISTLVDKWFAENTFDAGEFADIERLVHSKKNQGLTISLGLPTLNEEATIGELISKVKCELVDRHPLLDEIVVIDSQSSDKTVQIAKELGVPVHIHQQTLPGQGARRGKGEALWKSLYVLTGDIIAWIDTDIRNPDARFVYGLVGPLLKEPRIQYVKGYYRRPIQVGDTLHQTGGGRVTELTVRPLFNLFFPELSGLIQPLAGEYAGRRTCLEQLPFFTGYGVETGHLVDLLERFGLQAIGQVNLRERQHRNQELEALSQMAFAITQVIINRLEEREKLHLTQEVNRAMKLIKLGEQGLQLELRHIEDFERPPMLEVPEYRQKHRKRLIRLAK
jgi:glucosyl-3-phosphoglycerate synthase